MTREQTIKLLEVLKACYPNTKKIEDPRMMVEAWMMAFMDDDAGDVYKAARYHMSRNKYFPSVAEIKECMSKARIIYDNTAPNPRALPSGEREDADLIPLWQWACNLRADY